MATNTRRAAPRDAVEETAPPSSETATAQARAEKVRRELDALVDEIDEVLENNAEEFVLNYVQRGGE